MSVTVNNKSPIQDYFHADNHILPTGTYKFSQLLFAVTNLL